MCGHGLGVFHGIPGLRIHTSTKHENVNAGGNRATFRVDVVVGGGGGGGDGGSGGSGVGAIAVVFVGVGDGGGRGPCRSGRGGCGGHSWWRWCCCLGLKQ